MNGVVPLAATAISTSLSSMSCCAHQPDGLLGLVLGTFDRLQQRIVAAGHQQDQPLAGQLKVGISSAPSCTASRPEVPAPA